MGNFLTWEDSIRLCGNLRQLVLMVPTSLKSLTKDKESARDFKLDVQKFGEEVVNRTVPDKFLKEGFYHMAFLARDYNGEYHISIDPTYYFNSLLLNNCIDYKKVEPLLTKIDAQFYQDMGQDISLAIENYKASIKPLIRELKENAQRGLDGKAIFFRDGVKLSKDYFFEVKNSCLWLQRNIDTVVNSLLFCLTPEQEKNLIDRIDTEKFLGNIAYTCCSLAGFGEEDREHLDHEVPDEVLKFLNRYKAYINYRKSLDPNFNYTYRYYTGNNRHEDIYVNQFGEDIDEFYIESKSFKEEDYGTYTEEELLELIPDEKKRIEEVRKQERIDKFRREILLHYEIVPETETIKGSGTPKGLSIPRTEAEKSDAEEKAERDLEAKLTAIAKTGERTTLKGTDYLTGYEANVYPNGKVILEIFYRNTKKKGLVPAKVEAAYVMNLETFLTVGKWTKSEIREAATSGLYPDLKVTYHSKNYERNLLARLGEMDYDEATMDKIEEILAGLEQGKILRYDN